MIAARRKNRRSPRTAFTLIELMITITIIGIMASMMGIALFSAQEAAKVSKTKALIAKLDAIIKNKWDGYRTRRVPVQLPPDPGSASPGYANYKMNCQVLRLYGLRDLMRMEMPDRWTDVTDPPAAPLTFDSTQAAAPILNSASTIVRPSVSQGYLRRYNALPQPPSPKHQYAECLYMIVMAAVSEEGDAREVFKPDDVKDTDGDGMPEFVDAWGTPIWFLRWAPGFQSSELQVVTRGKTASTSGNVVTISGNQFNNSPIAYIGGTIIATSQVSPYQFDPTNAARITGYTNQGGSGAILTFSSSSSPTFSGPTAILAPDPFDPFKAYALTQVPSFALYPLIMSAGADKSQGIIADTSPTALSYANNGLNPFYVDSSNAMMGQSPNPNEPSNAIQDNIHNHLIGMR